MRPGLTISCTGHVVVLAWGLVAFAAKPNDAPPVEPLPVEFVSATEFSQLTAGVKNAPKPAENPKPLADKVGEDKPVKQLAPKVADKPEITTDTTAPPPPKSEAKPEAKPDPKPAEKAETPKPAEVKPDRVAEELKKEEAKKPPKPEKKEPQFKPDQIAEQLKRDEAKKPAPKFDADQVAALLDKREPQRQVATAATLNGVAALGAPTGHAAQLSQSELEALRAKLISLWNPPPAVSANPDQYVVTIHIRLTRDHRLIGQPQVLTGGDGPLFEATRDSAVRAVLQAQPYDMLSQSTYDLWKELDINFNPREVFGG
jgi:colicin import membrane protein